MNEFNWSSYAGTHFGNAHGIALDLARAIAEIEVLPRWSNDHEANIDPTLAGGTAGIALFLARAIEIDDNRNFVDAFRRYYSASVHALSAQKLAPNLFRGVTGIAWMIHETESVSREFGGFPRGIDLTPIDRAVSSWLIQGSWSANAELIYGAVGIGLYCLARLDAPESYRSLELIVEQLEHGARNGNPPGIWRTSAIGNKEIGEHINVGHAHGISGIIAFLSVLCIRNLFVTRARALITAAVDWLLEQRFQSTKRSLYPGIISKERAQEESQLAWCYGDLGIALALQFASEACANASWKNEAVVIGDHAARRGAEDSRADPCLCHGYAGIAHLFRRLHSYTASASCGTAADLWLDRLLHPEYSTSLVGRLQQEQNDFTGKNSSLLTGMAGIGLCLLAAGSPLDPKWDRVLLVST